MPGRPLAKVARLIANPTSAAVLEALCAVRELTVSGLARELGIPRSTVSESVTALVAAGLLRRRVEGRTAIVRLASSDVGEALEALGRLEEAPAPVGLRAVTRMQALRRARTCYDHLAGEIGVRLADRLQARGVLKADPDGPWRLSTSGRNKLIALGVDAALIAEPGRRPLVRACIDWTEKEPHVAGRVGGAICALWLQTGLARRVPGSRALQLAPDVKDWLARI